MKTSLAQRIVRAFFALLILGLGGCGAGSGGTHFALPDQALPEFRKLSAEKAQALLEHLDEWLSRHDRDTQPAVGGTGRNRAGIGIYYFEEPYEEEGE